MSNTTQIYEKNIPEDMKDVKQWGLVQLSGDEGHHRRKMPINARTGQAAKTNDPETWSTFEEALSGLDQFGGEALAFFFAKPYIGLDLDGMIGEIESWKYGDPASMVAQEISKLKTYVEVSQSGEGTHAIFRAPAGLPKGARKDTKNGIEMYDNVRFFAVTGYAINNVDQTAEFDEEQTKDIYDFYLGDFNDKKNENVNEVKPELNNLDEKEIIEAAENSKTGEKFKAFMKGDWESVGLYRSQSEADLAFMNDLAFWTGRDAEKMEKIFRASGMMRDKMERLMDKTIQIAIDGTENVYDPHGMTGTAGYDPDSPLVKSVMKLAKSMGSEHDYQPHLDPDKDYTNDDMGRGERFSDYYADNLRYIPSDDQWREYQHGAWKNIENAQVRGRAHDLIENFYQEHDKQVNRAVDAGEDPDKAEKSFRHFITQSRSSGSIKNMITESENVLLADTNDFDADPMLLNTPSGYVDLKDGSLHAEDRKKMFSQQTNIEFTQTVDAPRWEQFLNEIFQNDQALIDYVQRAVGYSLTGSTQEQVMFILLGNGSNGKSVFVDTISNILGSYTSAMQANALAAHKVRASEASPDIAGLKGVRLVTAAENNKGYRLNESLVKQLTGGDTVKARFLYGNEFEFKPQFTIWLSTNYRPNVRGTDYGIWRRLKEIPFNVKFTDKTKDIHLEQELQQEYMGILKWAIEGAIKWQKDGLHEPKTVTEATESYKQDMDQIGQFIEECYVEDDRAYLPRSVVYPLYAEWCDNSREHPMKKSEFNREMAKKYKLVTYYGKKCFKGLTQAAATSTDDKRLAFMHKV